MFLPAASSRSVRMKKKKKKKLVARTWQKLVFFSRVCLHAVVCNAFVNITILYAVVAQPAVFGVGGAALRERLY